MEVITDNSMVIDVSGFWAALQYLLRGAWLGLSWQGSLD